MQLNPILIKEMKVRARIVRIPIFVMAYNAVLSLIAIVMLISSSNMEGNLGYSNYRTMNEVFAGMGLVQCLVIMLVTLVLSAGSFSGERENGTWDMLLMTPVRTWEVANGKFLSAVLTSFVFTFSTLPIMALGTVYGGTDIMDIVYLMIILVILSCSSAAIGMLCSVFLKKTSVAVTFAIGMQLVITIGPFIFLDFLGSIFFNGYPYVGGSPLSVIAVLILSFNPVMLIVRFNDRIMGTQMLSQLFDYSYGVSEDSVLYPLIQGYFPEFSAIMQLMLVAAIFIIIVHIMRRSRNMD